MTEEIGVVFLENLEEVTDVKFQYFGLDAGATFLHPKFSSDTCFDYDGRIRCV